MRERERERERELFLLFTCPEGSAREGPTRPQRPLNEENEGTEEEDDSETRAGQMVSSAVVRFHLFLSLVYLNSHELLSIAPVPTTLFSSFPSARISIMRLTKEKRSR